MKLTMKYMKGNKTVEETGSLKIANARMAMGSLGSGVIYFSPGASSRGVTSVMTELVLLAWLERNPATLED
jgi:hypothetical protein